jgi:hypothetical protein
LERTESCGALCDRIWIWRIKTGYRAWVMRRVREREAEERRGR